MALPAGALTATVTVSVPSDVSGVVGTIEGFTVAPECRLVWASTGAAIEQWQAAVTAGSLTILADQAGVMTSGMVGGSAALVEVRSWPLVATWWAVSGTQRVRHTRRFAAPAAGATVDLDLLPEAGAMPPMAVTYAQNQYMETGGEAFALAAAASELASAGSASLAMTKAGEAKVAAEEAKVAAASAATAEAATNAVTFTPSTETLAPGSPATVAITGAAPNFNVAFGVPRGPVAEAQTMATAQGFWPIYSDTAPDVTTMYGVPVVWLRDTGFLSLTPAIPTAPVWSDAHTTVSIPSGLTGIEYRNGATVLTQGTTVPGVIGTTMTVTAMAAAGYTLPATYTWSHHFLDPSIAVLVASDSFGGATAPSIAGRMFDNLVYGGGGALQWFDTNMHANPFYVPPRWDWSRGGWQGGSGIRAGKFTWVQNLAAPTSVVATGSGTGGTLAAATYRYVVAALGADGWSPTSAEVSYAAMGSTSSVVLTWGAVANATSYKVYRSTAVGTEVLLTTQAETSFTDTGALTPGSEIPLWNTTPSGYPAQALANVGSLGQQIEFDVSGLSYATSEAFNIGLRAVGNPGNSFWTTGYGVRICPTAGGFAGTMNIGQSSATPPGGERPASVTLASRTWNGHWKVTLIGTTMTVTGPDGVETTGEVLPWVKSVEGTAVGTWFSSFLEAPFNALTSSIGVDNLIVKRYG